MLPGQDVLPKIVDSFSDMAFSSSRIQKARVNGSQTGQFEQGNMFRRPDIYVYGVAETEEAYTFHS
jgi:hypothetical protein